MKNGAFVVHMFHTLYSNMPLVSESICLVIKLAKRKEAFVLSMFFHISIVGILFFEEGSMFAKLLLSFQEVTIFLQIITLLFVIFFLP